MKIYVASSWRNKYQPEVVRVLRATNFEVYDFRNPAEGDYGFSWEEVDPNWQNWTFEEYKRALEHPAAKRGFNFDMEALSWCDACVLVLPCGRDAHLELGWACGRGKMTIIYSPPEIQVEPGLMSKMVNLQTSNLNDIKRLLRK